MKLLVKFNLVLFILFAIGIAGDRAVSRDLLQRNARAEIYQNAKLLIESALAVRDYTSRNIAPLLETQIKYEFRPEMVSAFSAIEVLRNLREANPEYKNFLYREATLNPTNPVNKRGRVGKRHRQRVPQRHGDAAAVRRARHAQRPHAASWPSRCAAAAPACAATTPPSWRRRR